MLRPMIGLLKPAPFAPPLPAEQVDARYKRHRRQVFVGIFVGYAAYYLVRNNLALAIPDILKEHLEYSKAALGTALTGLSIAYGLSKFLMGSISDRSNFLVVLERTDSVTWLSLRNAPQVHIVAVDQLNTYDVLASDDVVFTKGAFDALVNGSAKTAEEAAK